MENLQPERKRTLYWLVDLFWEISLLGDGCFWGYVCLFFKRKKENENKKMETLQKQKQMLFITHNSKWNQSWLFSLWSNTLKLNLSTVPRNDWNKFYFHSVAICEFQIKSNMSWIKKCMKLKQWLQSSSAQANTLLKR